jgi:hypothetical protein
MLNYNFGSSLVIFCPMPLLLVEYSSHVHKKRAFLALLNQGSEVNLARSALCTVALCAYEADSFRLHCPTATSLSWQMGSDAFRIISAARSINQKLLCFTTHRQFNKSIGDLSLCQLNAKWDHVSYFNYHYPFHWQCISLYTKSFRLAVSVSPSLLL